MTDEKKAMITKNSFVPGNKGPSKAEIKNHLRRIIQETHRRHKGQPGQYRINVMLGGAMGVFTREELEEMGVTVRDMPKVKGLNNG